jgi:lipopolysaccharide biosynthesis protein
LHKIGKETGYFPAGNMFWARIDAIHQIFEIDIEDDVPIERKQIDSTIIHAVERIWVYLAKLNGYYYTTTFREL